MYSVLCTLNCLSDHSQIMGWAFEHGPLLHSMQVHFHLVGHIAHGRFHRHTSLWDS